MWTNGWMDERKLAYTFREGWEGEYHDSGHSHLQKRDDHNLEYQWHACVSSQHTGSKVRRNVRIEMPDDTWF